MGITRAKRTVLICLALIQAASVQASDNGHVRVESVEGAKTVLLQQGLALREVSPGDVVEVGERIRTDEKTTVTISYADGSKLLILPNSDLEIERLKAGVQGNQLRSGMVKGSIEKARQAVPGDASHPSVKPPIKFVIRTKTATMGVRGTEFVAAFDAAQGLSQFNTLEGSVEVATSPAQLLGEGGVPVQSGQFIQATAEGGLSTVQGFNQTSFLGSISSRVSAAASGGQSGTGSSSSSGAPSVASVIHDSPPVTPAPPPNLPGVPPAPPPPPAVAQQKLAQAEEDKPHIHLFSFAVGAFMSQDPNPQAATGTSSIRALQIAWTPVIPLPVLRFLYVRGSFGATLFENYSLSSGFLVNEYQGFAGTTLLSPLYAEAGGGEQVWRSDALESNVLSANVGLIISPNGRWNRIFAGASKFFAGTEPLEIHAGIGINLF